MFKAVIESCLFVVGMTGMSFGQANAQVVLVEDFEPGSKPPMIWPAQSQSAFTIDTDQAKIGSASGKVTIDRADQFFAAYRYLNLKPGHQYEIRLWVKAEGIEFDAGGQVTTIIKFRDKDGDLTSHVIELPVDTSSDWTQVTEKVVSPEGTTSCQFLILSYRRTKGTVWVDGLEFEDLGPASAEEVAQVTPPPPPQVDPAGYKLTLQNGDFESGNKGWSPWFKEHQASWEIDTQEKRSGQASVRIEANEAGRHFLAQRIEGFAPGHTCRLSVWVKTQDNNPGGAAAILDFSPTAARPRPYLDLTNMQGSKPWQQRSLIFKVPADAKYAHLSLVNTGGTIWFDDLSVELLTEDTGNLVKPVNVGKPLEHKEGQGPVSMVPPLITEVPALPDNRAGYFFDATSEQVAYVSADAASLLRFQPINMQRHEPNLFVAVPEGIEILGGFRGIRIVDRGRTSIEDKPMTLYEMETSKGSSKFTFIWRADARLADAGRLKGYFWGQWGNGKQPRQTLDIEVVPVPRVTPFKQLPVWICYPSDLMAQWPNMADLYYSGINTLDVWAYMRPTSGETRSWGRDALVTAKVKADAANLNFYAWMREWWWHDGAKDDGGAALDIDGNKTPFICLSYRGRYFDEFITQGKHLIDQGVYRHSTDPEMYRDGDKICFDDKCIRHFRQFLAENYSSLAYKDPREFEKDQANHAQLHDAWQEFKVFQAAEFFAEYARQMKAYMASKGVEEKFSLYTMSTYHRWWDGYYGYDKVEDAPPYKITLESPEHWGRFCDFMAPMSYMDVYANHGNYDMLTTYKDAISIRRLLVGTDAFVAPLLCTGYPYTRGFNSDTNAEYLKNQILELFAGGAKGFGIWGECPLDAKDLKVIAEVVGQLQPYEELILMGEPSDDVHAEHNRVMAKRLTSFRGSLLLVSEYSSSPLADVIRFPVEVPSSVIRLDTDAIVAQITPQSNTFDVELAEDRAVMFAVIPSQ